MIRILIGILSPILLSAFVTASLNIGQLGNKLFVVATASALAWDHDTLAYFPDLLLYPVEHQHFFSRCYHTPLPKGYSHTWREPKDFVYTPIPYQPGIHISGYFQHENYFKKYRSRIIDLFAPTPQDMDYIMKKYNFILTHPCSVSVHVRDYAHEGADTSIHIQYGQDYFKKAMALFPKDALFIVTSDHMNFAKKVIPFQKNVLFIQHEPFYIDFYLQSLCKHHIISNSTFSWWSAWLSQNPEKMVVRPKLWIQKRENMACPKNWIMIDATPHI